MTSPRIAIISGNTLEAMGLESVINELLPAIEVSVFASLDEMLAAHAEGEASAPFFHYFASAKEVMGHRDFFAARQARTIVLVPSSAAGGAFFEHFHCLDPTLPEKLLVKAILQLNNRGHGAGHPHPSPDNRMGHIAPKASSAPALSQREAEVLALVVRGFINKEIADRLCISLTTVITHRKNICGKLHLHSVSALTVYAVMHGILRIDEI